MVVSQRRSWPAIREPKATSCEQEIMCVLARKMLSD